MHVVIVAFVAKPGFEERLRERILKQAADSLANEEACRVFDVCADRSNRARHVLYEIYDDEDAFAQHLSSPHFQAFDAETAEWVASKHVERLDRLENKLG